MSGRSPRWFTGIQYPWESNFAGNTWEQIIEVCQKKIVPPTWKVGDQKAMTIGGAEYLIDIIGINHDDYSDGSGKAPFTFQLHDCYGVLKNMNSSNTNVGGWADCIMRTEHLPAILATMPPEAQNGIREVNKLTSAGNKSTTIDTTADKLFLLSEIEIFGAVTYSVTGEGVQYDYYKTGGSTVKNYRGSERTWRERSPYASGSTYFCVVDSSGSANRYRTEETYGVPFCFCF